MAAAVLALLFLALPSAASEAPLPLAVQPESWEGGHLPLGSRLELEFVISNSSDQDIRLVYIFAECDCTLTVPSQGQVPAGGEEYLNVQLHLEGLEPGPLNETITILTDHPRQPEIRVALSAMVTAEGLPNI